MKTFFFPLLAPFEPFLTVFNILLLVSFFAASPHSKVTELHGPEHSQEIIAKASEETGFVFPEGSTGLASTYLPPIDPVYFAKIQIPPAGMETFLANFDRIQGCPDFPQDLANDRCSWWKFSREDVRHVKKGVLEGGFLEVYVVLEHGMFTVFMKKFTL